MQSVLCARNHPIIIMTVPSNIELISILVDGHIVTHLTLKNQTGLRCSFKRTPPSGTTATDSVPLLRVFSHIVVLLHDTIESIWLRYLRLHGYPHPLLNDEDFTYFHWHQWESFVSTVLNTDLLHHQFVHADYTWEVKQYLMLLPPERKRLIIFEWMFHELSSNRLGTFTTLIEFIRQFYEDTTSQLAHNTGAAVPSDTVQATWLFQHIDKENMMCGLSITRYKNPTLTQFVKHQHKLIDQLVHLALSSDVFVCEMHGALRNFTDRVKSLIMSHSLPSAVSSVVASVQSFYSCPIAQLRAGSEGSAACAVSAQSRHRLCKLRYDSRTYHEEGANSIPTVLLTHGLHTEIIQLRILIDHSSAVYSGSTETDYSLAEILPGELFCGLRLSLIYGNASIAQISYSATAKSHAVQFPYKWARVKCRRGMISEFPRVLLVVRDPLVIIWEEYLEEALCSLSPNTPLKPWWLISTRRWMSPVSSE